MDIIPEINCTSCGQKVPADRDCCPYCRSQIKSYWLEDRGNIKRAVPFLENGINYLFIDGKKISLKNLNEIPYAFKCMMEVKDRQPKNGLYRILEQVTQLVLERLSLREPVLPAQLPSQWDNWLDK